MEDERYYFQNSDEENNTGNQHTENDSSFTSEYTEPYRETEETEEAAGSAWQPRGDRHMSEDSREYYFFRRERDGGGKIRREKKALGSSRSVFCHGGGSGRRRIHRSTKPAKGEDASGTNLPSGSCVL